ncbi:hypothetical protein CkaCkLH20_01958 [Colletotrichum karsti]|uniref:Uncharacterized protein n=1 Tax=Colletotrichum karsti TaxID=1095194 RepID=A0A9P6IFF1_9PEZI|nr:uncharacterized protein CkaCkLH20_01958 [Colletotrichum karsti]KAF9880916.1 hypothetical protein CkaCkLH20_01958 [Colletotrichum karsti]
MGCCCSRSEDASGSTSSTGYPSTSSTSTRHIEKEFKKIKKRQINRFESILIAEKEDMRQANDAEERDEIQEKFNEVKRRVIDEFRDEWEAYEDPKPRFWGDSVSLQ